MQVYFALLQNDFLLFCCNSASFQWSMTSIYITHLLFAFAWGIFECLTAKYDNLNSKKDKYGKKEDKLKEHNGISSFLFSFFGGGGLGLPYNHLDLERQRGRWFQD